MVFALAPYPYRLTPMANIGPLTYTDGSTYLQELAYLKNWLNETLVAGVNDALTGLLTDFQAGIEHAEQAYTDFLANTDLALQALNDSAVATLINTPGSAAGTALRALIETLADVSEEFTAVQEELSLLETTTATNLANAVATLVPLTQKGAADGVATLDGFGKLTPAQAPVIPPASLSGTLTARPAGSTVPAGTAYYATDTAETYRAANNAWYLVGKGGFLGSAKLAATYETSAIDLTDVPGLAVTFVAGNGPVKITFSGEANNTVTNGKIIGAVYVGNTDVGHINVTITTANIGRDFTRVYLHTGLIPGEVYTAKVKIMAGYEAGGFAKLAGNPENSTLLMVESA